MKKLIYSLCAAVICAGMVSCVGSKTETSPNLQSVITEQTNQSIKYMAYAEQADKDSLPGVAAMFRAAGEAQLVSAAKLNEVLSAMGVKDFSPIIENPIAGTTSQNFKDAIEVENYMINTTLPEFVKVAGIENNEAAVNALNNTIAVQKHLQAIFTLTEQGLTSGDTIEMFYLCPVCGAVFTDTLPQNCDVCNTPSAQFKPFGKAKQ